MHCEVSGCGDLLAKDERTCLAAARDYLAYLPQRAGETPAVALARPPRADAKRIDDVLPVNQNQAADIFMAARCRFVDEGSFFEVKKLFARDAHWPGAPSTGASSMLSPPNLSGKAVSASSISAGQGKALRSGCATPSASRRCSADVPGFMIGEAVERQVHHPPRREDAVGHGRRCMGAARLGRPGARPTAWAPTPRSGPGPEPDANDRAAAGHDRRHGRRGRHATPGLREQDRRAARRPSGPPMSRSGRQYQARTSTSSSSRRAARRQPPLRMTTCAPVSCAASPTAAGDQPKTALTGGTRRRSATWWSLRGKMTPRWFTASR